MPPSEATRRAPRSMATFLSRLWRGLLLLGAGLLLSVAALSIAYRAMPPVSTLMLARWLTMQPVTREWVALGDVSPHLRAAVIAAEDARFCQHRGVDWDALDAVMNREGGPSRGASTLTMQVAKNLFLWPSRSYLRKALEIPLALWLDLIWTKRRTLEIYLNIAEWGPGLFGAQAASRAAFAKPAAALTPREAALLATALPDPLRRRAARPGRAHQRLAAIIAARAADAPALLSCLAP